MVLAAFLGKVPLHGFPCELLKLTQRPDPLFLFPLPELLSERQRDGSVCGLLAFLLHESMAQDYALGGNYPELSIDLLRALVAIV